MSSPGQTPIHRRLATPALGMIILVGSVTALYFARGILVPLVFAVILLYLVDSLNDVWFRILPERLHPPHWIATGISLLVLVGLLAGLGVLVVENANQLISASGRYQERFEIVYHRDVEPLVESIPGLEVGRLIDRVHVGDLITRLASGFASVVGQAALVVMFVTFLLLDRRFYARKMLHLFPDPMARRHADHLMENIEHDVRTYLGVKTLVSALTALPSYLIMRVVDLDFASFWAVIIFIFNFVPNIGSLVATLMPTALAFVQFDKAGPVLTIGVGITAVQLVVANLVEPNLMSRALNMSAFVVVLSLVAFGALWGMAGVFLCVPLTTILILISARFDSTRWLAILLSRDGDIETLDTAD